MLPRTLAASALAGFVSLSGSAALAQAFPWQSHPAGAGLARIAAVDFDADGRIDVVGTDPVARAFVVLSGRLPAHFAAPKSFALSDRPRELAVGDLDGDGALDLVAACPDEQTIVFRLNDPPGGMLIAESLDQGDECNGVALVDLNADGDLDLVCTRRNTKRLAFHDNDGGANFAPATTHLVNRLAEFVVSAELNGDGLPDFLVSSPENADPGEDRLSWIRKAPTGATYVNEAVVAAAKGIVAIAAADLDLDGDIDAVTLGDSFAQAHLQYGNGEAEVSALAILPLSAEPRSVDVADVDGDGAPDLVFAHAGVGAGLEPFANDGSGEFHALGAGYAIGVACADVRARDVDGDGNLDFLAARTDGRLDVVLGDGAGGSPGRLPLPAGHASHVADLNGDGRPDLVVEAEGKLRVHLGSNAGFGAPTDSIPHGTGASHIASVDLDLDGAPDLLADETSSLSVRWYRGLGLGKFAFAGEYDSGAPQARIHIGDFDGDARPDLLLADAGASGAPTKLLLNRLHFGFMSQVLVDVGFCPCAELAILDVDRDGRDDVVRTAEPGAAATWYRALGQFGFAPAQSLQGLAGVGAPLVGILDLDALPDVLFPRLAPAAGAWRLSGLPAGGFAPAQLLQTATLAAPRLLDLTGDGQLDLLAAGVLWAAAPGGLYVEWARYEGPTQGPAADVNGDGRLDLLVTSELGVAEPYVQLNLSTGIAGVHGYGAGVDGCAGAHVFEALSAPELGNSGFALRCSAAPSSGLGVGFVAAAPHYAGSSALGLGVPLYVDLSAAPGAYHFPLVAGADGVVQRTLPVPSAAALAGVRVWSQMLWLWPTSTCAPSAPVGLSATHGLELVLQP